MHDDWQIQLYPLSLFSCLQRVEVTVLTCRSHEHKAILWKHLVHTLFSCYAQCFCGIYWEMRTASVWGLSPCSGDLTSPETSAGPHFMASCGSSNRLFQRAARTPCEGEEINPLCRHNAPLHPSPEGQAHFPSAIAAVCPLSGAREVSDVWHQKALSTLIHPFLQSPAVLAHLQSIFHQSSPESLCTSNGARPEASRFCGLKFRSHITFTEAYCSFFNLD